MGGRHRDLDNLIEMEIAIDGKGYVFRGPAKGSVGKVFQSCGVALPPTLRPSSTSKTVRTEGEA